jgi:hypothetical protein
MNKLFYRPLILFFIAFSSVLLYGQTKADTLINNDLTFELKNDTLFSNTGLKLFIGQKLIIGNAAKGSGQYRSIISRKAAIVPTIFSRDTRYENAIENYVDTKKNKEKVKQSLIPGTLVMIKKISLWSNSKPRFFLAYLSSDLDAYSCDIKLALILKELLLQP